MISVEEFKQEVTNWAEELKLAPKEIQVREMSNKWASCSTKGRLSFSKALLEQPVEVRAKAIVYELLHPQVSQPWKNVQVTDDFIS